MVVTDTSPLFYLLSIHHVDVLAKLFGKVLVPDAVVNELMHPAAPQLVRDWASALPTWVEMKTVDLAADAALLQLGIGERAAILLAGSITADLILIDERKATQVALQQGFTVTGTLGILSLAARNGLIDLADSFAELKRTNFRYRQKIMDDLLQR